MTRDAMRGYMIGIAAVTISAVSRRACWGVLVGVLPGLLSCSSSSSSASNPVENRADASLDGGGSTGSLPVVTGPITGGSTGKPFTAAPLDLASYGYVEQEYFFAGTATAYDWVTPPTEDGAWSVKPTTTATYKTRMLVRRPTDPTKFNGTVIVEWFNDTGGVDADPEFGFAHVELLRSGFGYVGVSAQAQGVVCLLYTSRGSPSADNRVAARGQMAFIPRWWCSQQLAVTHSPKREVAP